jgi:archaemetzincin
VTRVYLAPLGTLSEDLLEAIEGCLRPAFELEVRRMHAQAEPLYAFDAGRRQYGSAQILKELVRHCPKGARVLGLTEMDLFIPTLSFVFGQAQLEGCAAIISTARLRQEYYQLPPNIRLLHSRARKESIHEIGHTLGLTHCQEASCPMSISTSVRQVDAKSELFCAACAVLLNEKMAPGRGRPGLFKDEEGSR